MTKLRPHKVLAKKQEGTDIHALTWTDGKYGGVIFAYSHVSFKEDLENDKLIMKFEYNIFEQPTWIVDFDKAEFEKELGAFLTDLLYYGLERDYLGFIDDNSTDHSIKLNSQ